MQSWKNISKSVAPNTWDVAEWSPAYFREQLAQDDAALEKYHLAAAKGEYRGKKRDRGIGLSDDESDPDDDANRRRRLAMRKKRVVVGGDQLEDLG